MRRHRWVRAALSTVALPLAMLAATACATATASVPLVMHEDAIDVGPIPEGGDVTFVVEVPGRGAHTLRICPAMNIDTCDGDELELDVTAADGPRDPSLVLGSSPQVRVAHLWTVTLTAMLEPGTTYRVFCAVPFHAPSGEQALIVVPG